MGEERGFPAPVGVRWGATDPTAPLVVLLHGRGATESDMARLGQHLPEGPAYVAVRAPLQEGTGYAWFANRGTGRPVAESLADTMAWFCSWLDSETTPGQPVVVVGFSGGAAFAGGLLLAHPRRFAAAGLLYGTLPFEAGVPVTSARLAGVPVFLIHGARDTVIPVELQRRTWEYLVKDAGCALWAERASTGHELTARTVTDLGRWISERLDFLHRHGADIDDGEPTWPALPGGTLPARAGDRPEISVATPQQQLSQNAPQRLQEIVYAEAAALPGVLGEASAISVPGARAFVLEPAYASGPENAFIVPAAREFAHLHPDYDGSLHLVLPTALARDALVKGWAVTHPLAGIRLATGMVMIYGPRDEDELRTVLGIVRASHAFASGGTDTTGPRVGVEDAGAARRVC